MPVRCTTYDRRGHGRADAPGHGVDADTLADDLAGLLQALDLHDLVLVGHCMRGGEVVRCLARHGTEGVRAVALVSSLTPYALATHDDPLGVPAALVEQLAALARDRAGRSAAGAHASFALSGAGSWVSPASVERTLHGMCATHQDRLSADLLELARAPACAP